MIAGGLLQAGYTNASSFSVLIVASTASRNFLRYLRLAWHPGLRRTRLSAMRECSHDPTIEKQYPRIDSPDSEQKTSPQTKNSIMRGEHSSTKDQPQDPPFQP